MIKVASVGDGGNVGLITLDRPKARGPRGHGAVSPLMPPRRP